MRLKRLSWDLRIPLTVCLGCAELVCKSWWKHCYMVISRVVEISHVHSAQIGACTYPRYHLLVSRLAAPHHATQFRYSVKILKKSAVTNCDISRKQINIPHSLSECCKLYKANPSNYQLIILNANLSL